MTDFQEKIQTGILTLCFHSRHLAFMGLVVIKGRCARLCCILSFSAIYMSTPSCVFMRIFFWVGNGIVDQGGDCFALNEIYLSWALTQTTPSCFLGNQ